MESATSSSSKLFQPIQVGHMRLQHRAAMAPMTRIRADDAHVPGEHAKLYYTQRSAAPGTLLVSEGTFISPRAGGYPKVPGIWNQAQVSAWKEITDAVHEKGCFIFCQLWALGRAADAAVLEAEGGFDVVSAGNVPMDEKHATPRPMNDQDIMTYLDEYGTAAKNAIAAGFDGVEIHGANGYIIDQFWQTMTNNRTDQYGGSIENRARFGLAVARAVVDAIGDGKKVAMRLSPFSKFQGMCMDEPIPQFSHVVRELKKLDLAYISLVDGSAEPGGSNDQTKDLDPLFQILGPDVPILLASGYNLEKSERVLDAYYPEHQLVVAFGRPFLSTPDLVARLKAREEMNKWDRSTMYGGGAKGYIDYPTSSQVGQQPML